MTREELENQYGRVWDAQELQRDYSVQAFMAPYVDVIRRHDGEKIILAFQHHPRFYFDPTGRSTS